MWELALEMPLKASIGKCLVVSGKITEKHELVEMSVYLS